MNFAIQGAFNNFVMQTTKVMTKVKEIVVNSPKYGQKIILIDSEDYELVSKYKWTIWSHGKSGTLYATTNFNGETHLLHRFILGLKKHSKFIGDHKDGNGLNNCRSNLRICTQKDNSKNQKVSKLSVTGFRGVHWYKAYSCYMVQITVNYQKIFIGYFKDKIEAAKAYNEVASKHHGEFAKLNEIPCAG